MEIYSNIESQKESLDKLSLKLNLVMLSLLLLAGAGFLISDDRDKKNIAEQERSRQQIEKAKKEWEKTFDSIDDTISIIGQDLKIKRINLSGVKKYDKSMEDLLGMECRGAGQLSD